MAEQKKIHEKWEEGGITILKKAPAKTEKKPAVKKNNAKKK